MMSFQNNEWDSGKFQQAPAPLLVGKNIKSIYITWNKQAGAELGQAQLKLELELDFT